MSLNAERAMRQEWNVVHKAGGAQMHDSYFATKEAAGTYRFVFRHALAQHGYDGPYEIVPVSVQSYEPLGLTEEQVYEYAREQHGLDGYGDPL
jgi:hypothetical protein